MDEELPPRTADELKYEIGVLKIDWKKAEYGEPSVFVVKVRGGIASLYASDTAPHTDHVVAEMRLEPSDVKGGGLLRLRDREIEMICGSLSYGAIPEYAANGFVELLKAELERLDIHVRCVNISAGRRLNAYWTTQAASAQAR